MTTTTITVQNKKYEYTLSPVKGTGAVVRFTCKAAKIDQEFLAEDIPALMFDLPALIVAEKKHTASQSEVVRFRVTAADKRKIEQKAIAKGFNSVSDYLRALAVAA
jgi:DNA-directed RNA polymerase subunit E'/Rpb7